MQVPTEIRKSSTFAVRLLGEGLRIPMGVV